ncbi:MAG: BspA family leucine-rich repeat surface protein [Prevotella sp.]|nr:BspA family leucine-rich repeat surface protein [Prevotella sp.]
MRTKVFLFMLCLLSLLIVTTGCHDEERELEEKKAEQIIDDINHLLTNDNNETVFIKEKKSGAFLIGLHNLSFVPRFVMNMIKKNYEGGSIIDTLPNNRGFITIEEKENQEFLAADKVFYKVEINVKDMSPITLLLVENSYFEGDRYNDGIEHSVYQCNICNNSMVVQSPPNRCVYCGPYEKPTFVKLEKKLQVLWFKDTSRLIFTYSDLPYQLGTSFNGNNVSDVGYDDNPNWYSFKTVEHITFYKSFSALEFTDLSNWFSRFGSIVSIDGMENFNTNKATNMRRLFYHCSSLTNIDLSSFNTENVKDMGYMFSSCSSLKNLDLSSFNTSNVETMEGMFKNCHSLETINLSSFTGEKVMSIDGMFEYCESLKSICFNMFQTDQLTHANDAFHGCSSLELLDLSPLFKLEKARESLFRYVPNNCFVFVNTKLYDRIKEFQLSIRERNLFLIEDSESKYRDDYNFVLCENCVMEKNKKYYFPYNAKIKNWSCETGDGDYNLHQEALNGNIYNYTISSPFQNNEYSMTFPKGYVTAN